MRLRVAEVGSKWVWVRPVGDGDGLSPEHLYRMAKGSVPKRPKGATVRPGDILDVSVSADLLRAARYEGMTVGDVDVALVQMAEWPPKAER